MSLACFRQGEAGTRMIGVVSKPTDADVVREFFELFKTPWQFYRDGMEYEILLCIGQPPPPNIQASKLVVVYSAIGLPKEEKIGTAKYGESTLLYDGACIPLYCGCLRLEAAREQSSLVEKDSGSPVLGVEINDVRTIARIGYNLADEVRALLTSGQPTAYAHIPAVELHIAVLRDLIVKSGAMLVEIPPIPDGFRFIACLTHDVDHPSFRSHFLDHTLMGFLYRSVIGSIAQCWRGRMSYRKLLRNWIAALRTPAVYLRLSADPWSNLEQYTQLEEGLTSTFFFIPFKNRAGKLIGGDAPPRRAARYSAEEMSHTILALAKAGCEIGLHGINAWLDPSQACAEKEQISKITGARQIGSRMHWLYFASQSPAVLDSAAIDYDSTQGYNETIGYRVGTTQAYAPLGVTRLLELPMHIMDTALFFPAHLNLSSHEAWKRVAGIIDNALTVGGCVTINWHDRSIAPERLWGDFYVDLLQELRRHNAWITTAARTVAWFRKRRSAEFRNLTAQSGEVRATVAVNPDDLPDLQVRVSSGEMEQTSIPLGAVLSCPGPAAKVERTIKIPFLASSRHTYVRSMAHQH